jgi:hypothetical protein
MPSQNYGVVLVLNFVPSLMSSTRIHAIAGGSSAWGVKQMPAGVVILVT